MQKYNPNYFLETPAHILENQNLREPQKQAYYKIYKHFMLDGKTSHAVVVLPTGVGKTGVIGIVPFQICKGRILIITPQLAVKETVIDSLNAADHNNFWNTRKVLSSMEDMPVMAEYAGKKTHESVLNSASVIVLNIHKLQDRLESSLLKVVPKDFFDMIIVDEAHHSTANTWIEALNYFSDAKVVKLTGTPIRSDGEKISGELVYEYKLSQAMANGYVKSLVKSDFIADDIEFICDENEDRVYSEKEILEIKDEDWVSRTVAYSERCSRQVVEESLKILKDKQRSSDLPHKIIAVACSISHAEKILLLYKEKGINAEVVHSGLSYQKIDEVKNDIKNNRIQVIVHVGMLGEGYDHKYLSIAAIFRPFRSALPYEQFIGRILRYIPDGISLEDNIARVVSHKLLYLDQLWAKYKNEYDESQIIKSLANQNVLKDEDSGGGNDESISQKTDIGVAYSSSGKLVSDSYVETEILTRHRIESEKVNEQIIKLAKVLETTEERAKQIFDAEKSKESRFVRLDLMFNQSRKDIDIRIKEEIVPELIIRHRHLLPEKKRNLKDCRIFEASNFNWITKYIKTEEGMLATYFGQYLKVEIGKAREQWDLKDYQRANELLDNQVEYIGNVLEKFYET